MLTPLDAFLDLLRCPVTGLPLERDGDHRLVTRGPADGATRSWPVIDGRPVLVDYRTSVLEEDRTVQRAASSDVRRRRYRGPQALARRLVARPNPASARYVRQFLALLRADGDQPTVLVVGGASIGDGTRPLYQDRNVRLIAFDIYGSPNVQLVADGHRIPLADASVDGVVCQAVMEHVLEPRTVATEIARVVRPGGLLYAETPFMQQVHEGAYDFTRFTESGHRYLFREFERLESGALTGPGMALLWAIDLFVRGLTRSRTAGKVAKLACFWLPWLDRFVPDTFAVDGASGVFLLGRRSDRTMQPRGAVEAYRGAQR